MPVYIRAIAASLTVTSVLFLSALILASTWGIDRKLTLMTTMTTEALDSQTDGAPRSAAKAEKSVSWEDLACDTREVVTRQGDNESLKDFCARHDAMVAHDKQVYGEKKKDGASAGDPGETWFTWYLERHPDEVLQDRPGL